MNTLNTSVAHTTIPAGTAAAPAQVQVSRRYRERDFGIGYGSSSGYASTRRYADSQGGAVLRFK